MGLTLPQGNALRMGFEMGLFTGDSSGVGRHWIGPIIPASPPCRLEHLLPFSCLLPPPAWELWVWRSGLVGKGKKHLEFGFLFGDDPGYNAGGRLEMLLCISTVCECGGSEAGDARQNGDCGL